MKFVIAGLGSIGRRHLRNLDALGEKDITLYRTHLSTLPEEDLAGYPVTSDLESALDARPDGVIISNPTAMHLDTAISAARRGLHVLLEKPISHSMDRVEEFKQLADSNGSRILMGFQFRYHPTLQKARSLILEQAIGRPVSARAHWGEYLPGWHPWEDHRAGYAARKELGGGVVLTLCHPLDYLTWMLGDVEAVTAQISPVEDVLQTDVDALAEISMHHLSGVVSNVHLDYIQRPGSHTLEINGTQGSLRWDNANGVLRLFRVQTDQWESFIPPVGFERNWLFMEEMRDFIRMIRNEQGEFCTLSDGMRAQKIVEAAYQSAESGIRVQLSN